ncbi:MAG: LLM class flavin-dependent oxidoreductase [Rhodospirillaceae bacterium]|nr:LLM class flavin-dependent oxidoreductase [Rhodospirillaceae bacterium]
MRIGFWPPVYGNWIMTDDPAISDASFATTQAAAEAADRLGFDTMLLAEHYIHPNGNRLDLLDAWTTAAALAATTTRIEILAAVKPGLRPPGVVAKMGANIDHISRGRFAVNLVSAWWPPEYAMLGADPLDHEDRYRRAEEFIAIVKGLWTQDEFAFAGRYFSTAAATIAPKPLRRPHPPIYMGGESETGRAVAARLADTYLMNGRPADEVAAIVADMDRRAAAHGRRLRHGLSAFVICRETEAAAQAEFERLAALRHLEVKGGDPTVAMHQAALQARMKVGTNGGTAAGLVGTPRQIADRIAAFHALGIETFLLQFHPTLAEVERFGAEVMPLLRGRPTSASAAIMDAAS